MKRILLSSLLQLLLLQTVWASSGRFDLTLQDAENRVVNVSNQLKGLVSVQAAATEQADAQFSALLPSLTFDAHYYYLTNVPSLSLPIPGMNETFPFGSHNNYTVGPTLRYTLFDMGQAHDAYRGLDLLAQSRDEDRKAGELQLLLNVRMSYLRVQLALEELRLLNSSLALSRAQNHDIESNFRAGAATRLDRVDSQRDVINYELQFEQKQSELAADFKDLLALVQMDPGGDLFKPGPPGVSGVELELNLDPLQRSLQQADQWRFAPPDETQPQVRSQELLTESYERQAKSEKAGLYPVVQVSANASIQYPNEIFLESVEQNTFAVTLSMPLFEGSHTRHLAAEKEKEAESARFNREQTRIDMDRDYGKALVLLKSLKDQQRLAIDDVQRSRDAANLYYQSYKGGKINLIDVQSANNRALTAQVNAARIDAQILNQLFILKSMSPKDLNGDNHGQL
jgi:outer membrane protein TolC